jgi:hypothetical protein
VACPDSLFGNMLAVLNCYPALHVTGAGCSGSVLAISNCCHVLHVAAAGPLLGVGSFARVFKAKWAGLDVVKVGGGHSTPCFALLSLC